MTPNAISLDCPLLPSYRIPRSARRLDKMKFRSIIPIIAAYMALVALLPGVAMAQNDTLWIPEDTLYFDGFRAVYSRNLDWERRWQVFIGDKLIMTSPQFNMIVNIGNVTCQVHSPNDTCNIVDLTGDGIGEVIFSYPSGGNDGTGSSFIYTLNPADSSAKRIGTFDGFKLGYDEVYPKDIDRDSIPEMISRNRMWECWNVPCAGSPAPLMIWKWTGKRYRLANFKYSNYILEKRGTAYKDTVWLTSSIRRWVRDVYGSPASGMPYPPEVWGATLDFIYAGRSREADSVFNAWWPPEIPDKEKCYKELWQHVHADPSWPELMKSDW